MPWLGRKGFPKGVYPARFPRAPGTNTGQALLAGYRAHECTVFDAPQSENGLRVYIHSRREWPPVPCAVLRPPRVPQSKRVHLPGLNRWLARKSKTPLEDELQRKLHLARRTGLAGREACGSETRDPLTRLTGMANVDPEGQLAGSVGSQIPLLNHWFTSRTILTGPIKSGRIVATPVRLLMFVVEVLPERMFRGFPDCSWTIVESCHPSTTRLPLNGNS